MNAIKKTDPYLKWKILVAEYEKSGLLQKDFCNERNIKLSQFVYYRSVIKSQDNVSANQKLFSAVQIKKSEPNTSAEIKIILPNGFQCFIPCIMDTLQLKRVMEVLLSC